MRSPLKLRPQLLQLKQVSAIYQNHTLHFATMVLQGEKMLTVLPPLSLSLLFFLSLSHHPVAAKPEAEPEIPPGQAFDVIISSTSDSEDIELAQLIKGTSSYMLN